MAQQKHHINIPTIAGFKAPAKVSDGRAHGGPYQATPLVTSWQISVLECVFLILQMRSK